MEESQFSKIYLAINFIEIHSEFWMTCSKLLGEFFHFLKGFRLLRRNGSIRVSLPYVEVIEIGIKEIKIRLLVLMPL